MRISDLNTLPLIIQSKIINIVGLDTLVKDIHFLKYIIDNGIIYAPELISSCIANRFLTNAHMYLGYIFCKVPVAKCFPGNDEFINQIAKIVMEDNIKCLKVYLWFFHEYANKLQKHILDMIYLMVIKKIS